MEQGKGSNNQRSQHQVMRIKKRHSGKKIAKDTKLVVSRRDPRYLEQTKDTGSYRKGMDRSKISKRSIRAVSPKESSTMKESKRSIRTVSPKESSTMKESKRSIRLVFPKPKKRDYQKNNKYKQQKLSKLQTKALEAATRKPLKYDAAGQGISRQNMKSQEPSVESMIKLTSRLKRRDKQVKEKKEMHSIMKGNEEKLSKDTRKKPQKKPEDNYKQVFPEVQLNFDPRCTKNPSARTMELLTGSEKLSATTSFESSKESGFMGENIISRRSLASTQIMSPSVSLAPTPKSQQASRIQSLRDRPNQGFDALQCETLPYSRLPYVRNKDNDGNLIIDGLPFWVEKMEEEPTDEGNVLNAAVIVEVAAGKLSLVNMPDQQIVLDIYEDWKMLRSRDAIYFNKDVLLGNTIRSMVNLFEGSTREKPQGSKRLASTKRSSSLLTMVHPTTVVLYPRDNLDFLTEIDFIPADKKKPSARPCDF